MKPLSERDENPNLPSETVISLIIVGMKPLSERDENLLIIKLLAHNIISL